MRGKTRHLRRLCAKEDKAPGKSTCEVGKVYTREVYVHRKRMCKGKLRA